MPPAPETTPPPATEGGRDVAAERAAAAIQRNTPATPAVTTTEAQPPPRPRPRVSQLTPDTESEFEPKDAVRNRVTGKEQPAPPATVAEPVPQPVAETTPPPAEAVPAEQTQDQVLADMRAQMEVLARQSLAQYGVTPDTVLAGGAQPAMQPQPQQPAQTPPSALYPQPQQSIPSATQSTYRPQFNLRVSAEEHAAVLQSPEGLEKMLTRVAEQAFNQGRLATMQEDLPAVNRGVQDVIDRQVAARVFFSENRDLRDYAATVALVAAKLRNTGKYTDTDTLLADTAAEVRATLRMGGGQAAQAASQAVLANAKVNGKPVVGAHFAGAGAATTTRQSPGNTNVNGKPKLVGDTVAEDMQLLTAGLF